jgi:hypothetical protein
VHKSAGFGANQRSLHLLESVFPGIRTGESPMKRKHLLCLAFPSQNP